MKRYRVLLRWEQECYVWVEAENEQQARDTAPAKPLDEERVIVGSLVIDAVEEETSWKMGDPLPSEQEPPPEWANIPAARAGAMPVCATCGGEGGEGLEDGWMPCYHCGERGVCDCEECSG